MNTKSIIIVFVVSFLFATDLFAFEDINYKISCKFDPDKKTIEAEEIISFKNTSGRDLKEVYFRIYPNTGL